MGRVSDGIDQAIPETLDAIEGRRLARKVADELVRRLGPDALASLGRLKRVSMWQTVTKDADGVAEVHDLHGFQLSPSWDEGPQWPPVQPGPVVRVPAVRCKPVVDGLERVVVLPDIQAGYYRAPGGELEPTHDEAAVDVAVALVRHVKPDRIVLLGDNADLPEFGRYRLSPAFQQTTQATVDWLTGLCARLRAAAPAAEIVWLAGNHEERLQFWLQDNARAAFGLRQGQTVEGWPVLSIPHLCRLDEHGVTYLPGYPANDLWLSPRLRIIHGDRVKSSGSTAHKYLDREKSSVIYGHIHRIERAHRTRQDHDGPREIMAASPGCLARIDGVVPSTKQGTDLDGRPLVSHEDWQQGLAVVTVDPGTGEFDYEQVRIAQGVAWFRGARFNVDT